MATGHWLQDTGYRTLATGRWLQDASYRTLATGRWLQDIGYRTLATGHTDSDGRIQRLPTTEIVIVCECLIRDIAARLLQEQGHLYISVESDTVTWR